MKDDSLKLSFRSSGLQSTFPVLQERLLGWRRRYPYEVAAEPDPLQADMQLLVARLRTPLDPLIIVDVDAIINSVRTGLDLMMAAVVRLAIIDPCRPSRYQIRRRPQLLQALGPFLFQPGFSPSAETRASGVSPI